MYICSDADFLGFFLGFSCLKQHKCRGFKWCMSTSGLKLKWMVFLFPRIFQGVSIGKNWSSTLLFYIITVCENQAKCLILQYFATFIVENQHLWCITIDVILANFGFAKIHKWDIFGDFQTQCVTRCQRLAFEFLDELLIIRDLCPYFLFSHADY